jgi:hypothetical protein
MATNAPKQICVSIPWAYGQKVMDSIEHGSGRGHLDREGTDPSNPIRTPASRSERSLMNRLSVSNVFNIVIFIHVVLNRAI